MAELTKKPKRPRGRAMPELIPDTPGNVVRALSQGPPKRGWKFMKPDGTGYHSTSRRTVRGALPAESAAVTSSFCAFTVPPRRLQSES